jgi:Ca-activated chloride channel family protein
VTLRRILRALVPLGWTLLFALPSSYLVLWAIGSVYEVPLRPESFRFERPFALLLLPAAVLVLAARAYIQRDAAPRLLVSRGVEIARSRQGFRIWAKDSTTGLRVTAVGLMALALMGPQSIHARDRAELEGIDIVLTLDASLSMQAGDIQPNRFEATKTVVDDFIRRRPNDRMAAVIFGRDAYTLLPLTTDKEALRTMIRELELGLIDGRGTAIGNAVGTALNRLRTSNAKSKVVILLTDGDSNSGNVSPEQAAELATVMHVKVYTILMGESDQARVQRGFGFGGRPLIDIGNFPVNPELLQSMAEQTGGEYFAVSDRQSLERSFHTILDRLEKSEIEDLGQTYGELFPAFLWPALALLALELLLGTLVFRRWP